MFFANEVRGRNAKPQLEAVIQECASVRYLLETLCKSRKKKTKK